METPHDRFEFHLHATIDQTAEANTYMAPAKARIYGRSRL